MFWQYNTLSTSQIESLLEKEDVGLTEVLEQEDIIQECKNQNKKLVEFLVKPDILSELIGLIINEPPKDMDESARFRLPHIAAEILSCEVPQLNTTISGEEALLDKLYSFMELEAPLNPLLASFFSKAFGVLITRKTEQNWYSYQFTCIQVFDFLKKKDFVVHTLRHVGTSAITDLVLRLITCVEGTDAKQSLLDWLNEKRLIQSIIGLLDGETHDRDTHDNASRLLIEILRVSRDGQYVPANERCDDPLLNTLESPETVDSLLAVIFGTRNKNEEQASRPPPESAVVNGISILLALLETRKAVNNDTMSAMVSYGLGGPDPNSNCDPSDSGLSPEDAAKQEAILEATIKSILPWLENFTKLLTDPPARPPMKSTAGLLDPPLGQTRLNVAKLICALLATNNMDVNQKLTELKTVDILLDLFFKYSLNNFLHAQVEQCVRLVFAWSVPRPRLPASSLEDQEEPPSDCGPLKTPPTNEMVGPEDSSEPTSTPEEATTAASNTETSDISPSQAEKEIPAEAAVEEEEEEEASKVDQEMKGEEEKPVTEKSEPIPVPSRGEEQQQQKVIMATSQPYDNPLLVHLYSSCHLVERVLLAWQENEGGETRPGFHRKGYMGHLTRIANIMHQHSEGKSDCQSLIKDQLTQLPEETSSSWSEFVSHKLAEINEKNTIIPASSYASNAVSSSEDDEADFRDVQFPQESALQQMQQMSDNFIGSFGFNDDEFTDANDQCGIMRGRAGMRNVTDVLSGGSSGGAGGSSPGAVQRAQDMFEAVCEQRFTSFPGDIDDDDDDDEDHDEDNDITDKTADKGEDEDPWAERTKEIGFKPPGSSDRSQVIKDLQDSSDDEEEDDVDVVIEHAIHEDGPSDEHKEERATKKAKAADSDSKMEVDEDPWSGLNSKSSEETSVAMDTGNPWDQTCSNAETVPSVQVGSPTKTQQPSAASSDATEEGWADFDNADSEMSPIKTASSPTSAGRFDVSVVNDVNTSPIGSPTSSSPNKRPIQDFAEEEKAKEEAESDSPKLKSSPQKLNAEDSRTPPPVAQW